MNEHKGIHRSGGHTCQALFHLRDRYRASMLNVTVRYTATGLPSFIAGIYFHCRTASITAWSKGGLDWTTRIFSTVPCAEMTASIITGAPVTALPLSDSGILGST